MLIKKKFWVIVVIGVIVLLMLATQTMHRRHFFLSPGTSAGDLYTEETLKEAEALVKVGAPDNTNLLDQILSDGDHLEEDAPKRHTEEQSNDVVRASEAVNKLGGKETDKEVKEKKTVTVKAEKETKELVVQSKAVKSSTRPCGCKESCVSVVDGYEWFSKHYDPKQEPIVRKTNTFEPDALKWWLALQRSGTEHTIYEIIENMYKVISPPTLVTKPLPGRCRTCAVVGNSGNLLGSGYGKLINSFGSIIRMNKAVTKGFEKDVGNRTTYHIMYPESAIDLEPGVGLVLLPFKLRDLEWLTSALSTGEIKSTYMRVKNLVKADKDKVLVVNPVFFKYVNDHWTEHHGRYPSTGMLALVYALHICDQVSVFGYGADKQGNWHHYWEQNRNAGAFRKTGVHSADYEHEVIHQLAKDKKIDLHM